VNIRKFAPFWIINAMRLIFVICLSAVFLLHVQPGYAQDGPEQAVQDYVTALLALDYDRVQEMACEADQQHLDEQAFGARLAQFGVLELSLDSSALRYTPVQKSPNWAQVRVSGAVLVVVAGLDEPVALTPVSLGLDTLWATLEDGGWKVCTIPPDEVTREPGPGDVTRQYLIAAYGGDYDGAVALLCEERRGSLSRDEFEALRQQLAEQEIQISFDFVGVEIVEQTDTTAVVRITGVVRLRSKDDPKPFTMPVAQLGFDTAHLVYEDGWKICQMASVES
jgi:hypothetical protein